MRFMIMKTEQLNLDSEPGWQHDQRIPKEFADKPALELCWRGLVISISEGQMTRRQAYEMLERLNEEDVAVNIPRAITPPSL